MSSANKMEAALKLESSFQLKGDTKIDGGVSVTKEGASGTSNGPGEEVGASSMPPHPFTLFEPVFYTEYGSGGGSIPGMTPPQPTKDKSESPNKFSYLFTLIPDREFPNYKFFYQRDCSGRNPPRFRAGGIALTEELMLEVALPKEVIPVDRFLLKVTDTQIDLDTAFYCMRLPLKHQIDSTWYRSGYDKATKKLYVELRLKWK